MENQDMNQEITCPKCSYQFAVDQALNREIELQMVRIPTGARF
jgi:hypothetical protein